jgi:hypothetical protein
MSEHRVDVQCAAGGGRAGDRAEIAHSIAALISIRPIDRICSAYVDEEKSSAIEFVLDDFNVIVCERAKQTCRVCAEGVVVAAAADNVIEGGLPGPGLVARARAAGRPSGLAECRRVLPTRAPLRNPH